jgi:hypothetical protein
MTDTLPPIRRILTEDNDQHRSRIVEDGPSPSVRIVPERPGYRVSNIWRMTESPGKLEAADSIAEHRGVLPPQNGNVIRVIDYPADPQDMDQLRVMQNATFGTMFQDADRDVQPGSHPGMHRTDTVDYAILLAGEMVAIMDDGETVMRAGDILIQRGTNHAWANRSGKPARIVFVLVDGARKHPLPAGTH